MNPAFSVVFLTTVTGAGYGMLVWLGALHAVGDLPRSAWFGVPGLLIALVLIVAGLLASTFHLGRPERAWRAMSQWRTSWLSREGVMALITFVPAVGFLAAWLLTGGGATATVLGLVAGVCALVTVACQAMIYASLKPVRQWDHPAVLPNFLLLALYTGAISVSALEVFFNPPAERVVAGLALMAGVVALFGKLGYWRSIDAGRGGPTIGTATGLGGLGTVRSLERPHTEENYLLREMGFAIGRRHAQRLRKVVIVVGFALPILLLLAGLLGDVLLGQGSPLVVLAALCALAGTYVERWLFFAEATHTVTLYYGRPG